MRGRMRDVKVGVRRARSARQAPPAVTCWEGAAARPALLWCSSALAECLLLPGVRWLVYSALLCRATLCEWGWQRQRRRRRQGHLRLRRRLPLVPACALLTARCPTSNPTMALVCSAARLARRPCAVAAGAHASKRRHTQRPLSAQPTAVKRRHRARRGQQRQRVCAG
jgi:hypothetical protein